MVAITEDVRNLFNEVLQEISQNIYHMMEELWTNWSHLGVDNAIKISNITKLVQIEKDLHREVILETQQKFRTMQNQIEKLKEETEELSRCLSVDITLMDLKDDMLLFDYKKELENRIAGYREQVLQRRMKMERLLEWQKDIGEKLGTTIYELQDVPLPSEEELDKLKNHLEVLQAERDKRVEIFLNTQVEIKDIMEKLHIKPQNKFEQLVVTSLSVDFKVTDLNMDRLAKLQQDLQDKYQQTNNRVLELRERLAKLWDCLEEDHIYRENFLQAHIGCNPDTENALKEEIRRCDQIKRQKIQVFVANVRTKIKLMWDNLMYSTKERDEFVHYYQDTFTEDVLTLHELYLEKLNKYYNEQKEIFELVATRKNLWSKMTELEARATEPGRYHNRGGQLLKEEKERKAIASNLPKIEAQIRELVTAYQERNGKIFTVDGKPLLQLMLDDWEDRKAERHNKLSARKQALTPSTPMFRSMATSPLGKRNRTAAGLASTAEKNRLPVKRQLVTGSANKAVSTHAGNMSALKRTAMSTIKRRISGRLVAKAGGDVKANQVKRMLDYGSNDSKTPKITVNSNILKHKRTSHGRRSNGGRSNMSSQEEEPSLNKMKNPLSETTLLTTYTDFKDGINENHIGRSSMAVRDHEAQIPNVRIEVFDTPKRTPRTRALQTPKMEKENIYHPNKVPTTMTSIMCTPQRLTRSKSISKLNNDGFATPQPLSAKKEYVRQHPGTPLSVKNTPNHVRRSKSQTHMARAKDLPPIL